MKELLHKWRRTAQGLSDVELTMLLQYFQGLQFAFGYHVPTEYVLMYNDIERQVNRLIDMQTARKEKQQ